MSIAISKKKIITNIVLLFSATAFGQAFLAISTLLTARPLGVELFGQYAACFALTKITSIVFNLGMDSWLLREGRRGEIHIDKLTACNLTVKAGMGLIWFASLFVASQFLDPITYPPRLLFMSALATWIEAALTTVTYSFNTSLRNQATAVLTTSASLSLLIATIILVYTNQDDPIAFVNVRFLTSFLATLGGLIWLFRKTSAFSVKPSTIKFMLKGLPPFALSDLMVLVYTQADITLVAVMLGKQAAGAYSPASNILRALFVVPSAIFMVMTPVISQLVAEGSQRLSKTIRETNLALAAIGAVLWLGTSLMGPIVVFLVLGAEFSLSGQILVILGAIIFIKSSSYASAAVIIATGKQGQRVIVQGIVAVTNVILNLLIINKIGVFGVAWVYLISESILLAGYMLLAENGRIKAISKIKSIPSI